MPPHRINITKNNNRLRHTYAADEKYGANSKTALFIISGEKESLGEVLCINNEVSELLGFERTEIIAHNISKAMPPVIGNKHSQLILNFYSGGKYSATNDKLVLPLHKLGYLVPCAYISRVIPNLSRGLQLIGFLSRISDFSEFCSIAEKNSNPDDFIIMLADELWMLHSFNLRASRIFGVNPLQADLKKYSAAEEKILVKKMIPELEDLTFLASAKSPQSADTILNLPVIQKVIESEVELMPGDQESAVAVVNSTYVAPSSSSLRVSDDVLP